MSRYIFKKIKIILDEVCFKGDGNKCDYGGIYCGEVFEFKLNDVWVPARVEMGDDRKWYLVGLPGLKLDGLEVKVE